MAAVHHQWLWDRFARCQDFWRSSLSSWLLFCFGTNLAWQSIFWDSARFLELILNCSTTKDGVTTAVTLLVRATEQMIRHVLLKYGSFNCLTNVSMTLKLYISKVTDDRAVSVCTCEDVLSQPRRSAVFPVVEVLRWGGALKVLHRQTVTQDILVQVGARPKLSIRGIRITCLRELCWVNKTTPTGVQGYTT